MRSLRTGVGLHDALPAHRVDPGSILGRSWVDPGRVKQPDAVAQHHRREMHMELIDQAALQALSGEVSPKHLEVLPTCRDQTGLHRLGDVAVEEDDALVGCGVFGMVGEHEIGPLQAPPYGAAKS
jgi:hypothetical protein